MRTVYVICCLLMAGFLLAQPKLDTARLWQLGPVLEYRLTEASAQVVLKDLKQLTRTPVPISGYQFATDQSDLWVKRLLDDVTKQAGISYTTKPLTDSLVPPTTWRQLGERIRDSIGTNYSLHNYYLAEFEDNPPVADRQQLAKRFYQFGVWANYQLYRHKIPALGNPAYLRQRNALLPYIVSALQDTSLHGQLMRPLGKGFANDPNTERIADQYMFGHAFMVAPVYSPENTRNLYLPQGDWMDLYTGTLHAGGQWKNFPLNEEHLPVFVKMGSFVALATPKRVQAQNDSLNLDLRFYSYDGQYTFDLVDPRTGESYNMYAFSDDVQMQVFVPAMPFTGTFGVYLYNLPPLEVTINGQPAAPLIIDNWLNLTLVPGQELRLEVTK